jgi:hypothetical protein
MARAKKTTVTLTATTNGKAVEFDVEHAERLLRFPNTAWRLTDEKFTFDIENGISRANTRRNKTSEGTADC